MDRKGRQPTRPSLGDFRGSNKNISGVPASLAAMLPGTVGVYLPVGFDRGKSHDFRSLSGGWLLHAPCARSDLSQTASTVQFELGRGDRP